MLPFKDIHVLDRNAEYLGVPTSQLMENAGEAVAEVVKQRLELEGKNILVFCGTGNNGGDGFVAARKLRSLADVKVLLLYPVHSIKSKLALDNLKHVMDVADVIGSTDDVEREIENADVIIDSMLGIGVKGSLREPYRSVVRLVNSSKVPVFSVDVPSGLGTDTVLKPTITITFHDVKQGMTPENSGEIVVADIGIPADAGRIAGPGSLAYYPKPAPGSHKGQNGCVLVIGGGTYTGAPALAGLAALRVGADLAILAVPEYARQPIASQSPDLIVHPMGEKGSDKLVPDDVSALLDLANGVDAVVVGPGAGNDVETQKAIMEFVSNCGKPMVLDADALKAVAQSLDALKGKAGILTPHAREFELLAGQNAGDSEQERMDAAGALASKLGWTILLKGMTDVISDGKRTRLNGTGNPGMTVGGTGDVLAGITGGILSKGADAFWSAAMAAFVCGSAGDAAFAEKGCGLLATDVLENIPGVLKQWL